MRHASRNHRAGKAPCNTAKALDWSHDRPRKRPQPQRTTVTRSLIYDKPRYGSGHIRSHGLSGQRQYSGKQHRDRRMGRDYGARLSFPETGPDAEYEGGSSDCVQVLIGFVKTLFSFLPCCPLGYREVVLRNRNRNRWRWRYGHDSGVRP